MHIFIDESGNFIIPKDNDSKISTVTSLIIPDKQIDRVLHDYDILKKTWGYDGEAKGSKLTEKQISNTLALLRSYDVIVEISWLNVGHHTVKSVGEYKTTQANKILENVTEEHHESLVNQLKDYRQRMLDLPNQLFLQAMLSVYHIHEVFTNSTIYYCQRIPEELGDFIWLLDAKNSSIDKTPFEELWSTLILPITDANFILKTLQGGDYSHFERKYSVAKEDISEWRRARMPKDAIEAFDAKRILKEHFSFQDSRSHLGLQLVDIVSSTFSRAMNGTLGYKGWRHLGRLMVKAQKFLVFDLEKGERFTVENRHSLIWKKLRSNLKPILLQ